MKFSGAQKLWVAAMKWKELRINRDQAEENQMSTE